jgi:hypothetical protein
MLEDVVSLTVGATLFEALLPSHSCNSWNQDAGEHGIREVSF